MFALCCFVLAVFASSFKSKSRLEAENAALRHRVMVFRRQVRGRVHLTNFDRLFLFQLLPLVPIDPAGSRHRSAGDDRSLASGRLSLLLALEITRVGRAAAD